MNQTAVLGFRFGFETSERVGDGAHHSNQSTGYTTECSVYDREYGLHCHRVTNVNAVAIERDVVYKILT